MNFKEALSEQLKRTKVLLNKGTDQLEYMELFFERNDFMEFYNQSFKFQASMENLVKVSRTIPSMTGVPNSIDKVREVIKEETDINIEFDDSKKTFKMIMPSLLPKKESGDASYMRSVVEVAMRSYFDKLDYSRIEGDSVIVFNHIYSNCRPDREFRDHDNIELNVIIDLIALYILIDDHPLKLKHYYTSQAGEEDKTIIQIIPKEDFGSWFLNNELRG